jgi:hypothetical protein
MRVLAHRKRSRGIAEWVMMGPSPVANSLSCSKESLDQGEGLGGWELSEGFDWLVTYDIFCVMNRTSVAIGRLLSTGKFRIDC